MRFGLSQVVNPSSAVSAVDLGATSASRQRLRAEVRLRQQIQLLLATSAPEPLAADAQPTPIGPDLWLAETRSWLSELVVGQATATAERLGFDWEVSPDAPDTFDKLKAEFSDCVATGRPLRVAQINADPSIFGCASVTYAMRFWHDVTHVELAADFGFADEMRVAAAHLEALVDAGQPEGSAAWHLLRADTVGQNYVYAMTNGGFVPDQLVFARTALTTGLPFAVLAAVEEIEDRSVGLEDTARLLDLMVKSS